MHGGVLRATGADASPTGTRPGPEPRWRATPASELVVTTCALGLFTWQLGRNGAANPYYAAAARSMTASMRNFGFGSHDPGGWITTDKPPLALWVQAASARIFGLSAWSLLLPGACCGALSVRVLMAAVRRVWGREAGLVAGGVLALTPATVAVSRTSNPDVYLLLFAVLAAWAVTRGIDDGRLRWMLLAGLCCGLGFLAKLLAIGLVMPGLWCTFLVAAPGRARRRTAHALAGALVFVAVAGAWVGAIQLTPLAERPWIGNSTDGGAVDLVFGYNGFGRVLDAGAGQPVAAEGEAKAGRPTGPARLLAPGVGDQILWLAPLAVLSAAAGLAVGARHDRRHPASGSLLLWTLWAGGVAPVLTFAPGLFQNYYVSLLAPALAALVGIGVTLVRTADRRGPTAAAVGLAATAGSQAVILRRAGEGLLPWLAAPALAGTLALVALASRHRRLPVAGPVVAGLVALAVLPASWSVSGTQHPLSSWGPQASPRPAKAQTEAATGEWAPPAPMVAWLRARRTGEEWILGVQASTQANELIIRGDPVVALGGFVGTDAASRPERVAPAVASGRLRFILVHAPDRSHPGNGNLAPVLARACPSVDPRAWGGAPVAGTLYDCQGRADALLAHADLYVPGVP